MDFAEGQGFEPWVGGYPTTVFKTVPAFLRFRRSEGVFDRKFSRISSFCTRSVHASTRNQPVFGSARGLARGCSVRTVRAMCNETKWLTVTEACKVARCSRAGMYKWWAIGDGPRYSEIGRKRLIREDWLEDWLLAGEVL